jgi:hypothetical protein
MLRGRTRGYKVPRCTKCDRPRRGHDGPCGTRCKMPSPSLVENAGVNDWESVSNVEGDPPVHPVNETAPVFIRELARQLGS